MVLVAEPHSTGTKRRASVPSRSACDDLLVGERTVLEILLGQRVVGLGGRLDHALARRLGGGLLRRPGSAPP